MLFFFLLLQIEPCFWLLWFFCFIPLIFLFLWQGRSHSSHLDSRVRGMLLVQCVCSQREREKERDSRQLTFRD